MVWPGLVGLGAVRRGDARLGKDTSGIVRRRVQVPPVGLVIYSEKGRKMYSLIPESKTHLTARTFWAQLKTILTPVAAMFLLCFATAATCLLAAVLVVPADVLLGFCAQYWSFCRV
jgi:hypothetical protein